MERTRRDDDDDDDDGVVLLPASLVLDDFAAVRPRTGLVAPGVAPPAAAGLTFLVLSPGREGHVPLDEPHAVLPFFAPVAPSAPPSSFLGVSFVAT